MTGERGLVLVVLPVVIGLPAGITWAKGQRSALAVGWYSLARSG